MIYLSLVVIIILLIIIYRINKQLSEYKNAVIESEKDGFFLQICRPFIDLYNKFNFILYLTFSVLLYFLASQDYKDLHVIGGQSISSQSIKNILTTIATVVLSSGVFSSITKSRHFLSIFSSEIKKIIYVEDFLTKQKNIDKIWNIATKSLCSENFHQIGDKLYDSIKSTYLPINHNFYYQDFKLELIINLVDENPNYVIIEEITTVDLICENTDEIIYKYSSHIDYDLNSPDDTTFDIIKFEVNGKDDSSRLVHTIIKEDEFLKAEIEVGLKGHKTYSISRVERKKYSIALNSLRVHSAVKIYNNFELSVFYPSCLNVKFSKLGINNNWNNVIIRNIDENTRFLKTSYDGVFFQNQGYMLNFIKK